MAQYLLLQPLTGNRQAQQPQVHLAREINSNDLVVIKWLNDKSSAVEQRWFKQELAVLQHLVSGSNYPYVLAVIEVGYDGLFLSQLKGEKTLAAQQCLAAQYLVMPYVKQGSLATALTKKSFDIKDIHYIFMQLIDAVEKLHHYGWLHLDLKPPGRHRRARGSCSPGQWPRRRKVQGFFVACRELTASAATHQGAQAWVLKL